MFYEKQNKKAYLFITQGSAWVLMMYMVMLPLNITLWQHCFEVLEGVVPFQVINFNI